MKLIAISKRRKAAGEMYWEVQSIVLHPTLREATVRIDRGDKQNDQLRRLGSSTLTVREEEYDAFRADLAARGDEAAVEAVFKAAQEL